MNDVFSSNFLAKLMYSSSGFCSTVHHAQMELFLHRCQWFGYSDCDMLTLSEMFDKADGPLFHHILHNKTYTLQSFPQNKFCSQYNLQTTSNNKELITETTELNSGDFL